MKKRSLFAAVAMLIVSAVVLTSATYAWFKTSGSVTIGDFSMSTSSATAGLVISTTGNDNTWVNKLEQADYALQTGYSCPSAGFIPVDGTIGTNTPVTFKNGSLAGTEFTWLNQAPQDSDNYYLRYITYVKATAGNQQVTVTPNIKNARTAQDQTAPDLAEYIYYEAVIETVTTGQGVTAVSKQYDCNAKANKSYNILSGASLGTSKLNDTNTNGIIDDAEKGSLTLTSSGTINAFNQTAAHTALDFLAQQDVVYKITVTVWAEGQDSSCVSGAAASSTCVVQLGLQGADPT